MRRIIAAGLGLGWIPRRVWGSDSGAGTLGAGLAALIGLALWTAPWWVDLTVAAVAVAVALWASTPVGRTGDDPGWVIIDEIAGTLVAMVGLTGPPWVVAVVVARLGDIFKVAPGVRRAERLPPPLGITADDVLAGFYGLAAGWLVRGLLDIS